MQSACGLLWTRDNLFLIFTSYCEIKTRKDVLLKLWNKSQSYSSTTIKWHLLLHDPKKSLDCLWRFCPRPVRKNVDNSNRLEYFEKNLPMHWYWQDVAQGIVKCHLGLAEALLRFKFWKKRKKEKVNSPISWTEWNILINFWVNIDINKN